jgi:hypothetical protein
MPNWVSNALKVIKGDPKEVFELIRTEQSVFPSTSLFRCRNPSGFVMRK